MSELSIMTSLSHPFTVALKEKWRSQDYFYLILEHCNGGDLSRAIKSSLRVTNNSKVRRGIPELIARRTAFHVVSALHELHSRNIIHRDVKSANVMI